MNRRKFLKACLSAGVAMNLENVRAVEFCESVPDMIDAVRCKVGLKSNVVAAFADVSHFQTNLPQPKKVG